MEKETASDCKNTQDTQYQAYRIIYTIRLLSAVILGTIYNEDRTSPEGQKGRMICSSG